MSTIRVSAMDVARTLTRSEADTCLHVFVTCQLGIPRGRNGVWLLAAQAYRDCCMMHVCLWTPQNAANCEFVDSANPGSAGTVGVLIHAPLAGCKRQGHSVSLRPTHHSCGV